MKTSRIVGSMMAASVAVAALTGGAVALADQDDAGTTSQESRQGPGPGGHGPNKLGQMAQTGEQQQQQQQRGAPGNARGPG